MKRIAFLILIGFSVVACNNPIDPDPDPDPDPRLTDTKAISLQIHVPPKSISTYAEEDASTWENRIDSIFIDLYEGVPPTLTLLNHGKFGVSDIQRMSDSIYIVGYEVDNITTGPLSVEVFANHPSPTRLTQLSATEIEEILIPEAAMNTHFFMSGMADLTSGVTAYEGVVHVVRNVAKLRINISKNTVVIPSDLIIDYKNIKIQVINATDSTTAFGPTVDGPGIGYFNYPERVSPNLRRGTSFDDNAPPVGDSIGGLGNGGFIDSLYLHENYRSNYDAGGSNDRTTQVKVTVPTRSFTEGNKTATYTYPLSTTLTGYGIWRNHIYTLDIKVRGQELDPLITLDISPWEDVPADGSIGGTELTLDKSEIEFDATTGEVTINYCTDAQAIYFNFTEFNDNNTPQLGGAIEIIGIETPPPPMTLFPLAPDGFQDGQIIIDKNYCGSFKFKLDPVYFNNNFASVNFSGKICLKAGNTVKCLTFPAKQTFDAHFIVGDTILNGELFAEAKVTTGSSWLEVSTSRYWNNAANSTYSGAAVPLYLHMDENLSNQARNGTIELVNNAGAVKTLFVTQLPAIFVGKFGYDGMSSSDDSIYTAQLFTEQLYEFPTMPAFMPAGGSQALPNNALYNGRVSALYSPVFESTNYNPGLFDYHTTVYEAINYCAFKNRPATKISPNVDIKWYLPSQAQLMAMWVTYAAYKDEPASNFYRMVSGARTPADIFWSSTDNAGYAEEAQLVDFRYGNVGHYYRHQKYWARCVRDGGPISNQMVQQRDTTITSVLYHYAYLSFDLGLPGNFPLPPALVGSALTLDSKNNVSGHENSIQNEKLYLGLRVAKHDLGSIAGVPGSGVLLPWSLDLCDSYTHPDEPTLILGYQWRLPTQRELQAIWLLQREIQSVITDGTFEPLSDNYYWSATEASTTSGSNYWTVFGSGSRGLIGGAGNVPHQLNQTPLRVRCVAEYLY